MDQDDGFALTADGLRLHWRSAAPPRPRAACVLVHGLGEHTGRYAHVSSHLVQQDLATWVFDLRGHGLSEGLGGHVDSFGDYLEDLRTILGLAADRHPGMPLFLLGHSMGGLVALRHAQTRPRGLQGLVLSSPLLGIAPASRPGAARALLGRLASALLPRLRLATNVDPSHLSRDPAVGAAYARDPLVGRRVSARWFTSVAGAMAEACAAAPPAELPVLLMAAGDDRLADTEAARRFASATPARWLELQVWDGFYHELLNAPERDAVLLRVSGWIAGRLQA